MARPLRIEYPGAVYHVTSRGNEKKPVFRDDQDRTNFLNTIQHVIKRYHWICHAYCLMDNHYHLLIETPDGNLALGMRQLNGVYTQLFNKRHARVGHLFQGRYKAILIQKDTHLLEVCRYVVLNPVRAKMVQAPEQWSWSSYQATAGKALCHPCLTRDWVLRQFSSKKGIAEKEYREFVRRGIGKGTIWEDLKGQSLLGEEEFVDGLIDYLSPYKNVPEIPRSQRFANRPSLEKMFTPDVINKRQKRNRAIAVAIEKHGYRQREVAEYLGMYFTSISRTVNSAKAQ
jgi:putative transposase